MINIAFANIKKEEGSLIKNILNKSDIKIDWLTSDLNFISKYDIFIIPPDINLAQSIYKKHNKRPYVFIMNGHVIDYHTLKVLVNLGIAGLIEENDMTPLLKIIRLIQKTKAAYQRLSEKMIPTLATS